MLERCRRVGRDACVQVRHAGRPVWSQLTETTLVSAPFIRQRKRGWRHYFGDGCRPSELRQIRVEVCCPLAAGVEQLVFWTPNTGLRYFVVDVSPPVNLSASPVQILTIGT